MKRTLLLGALLVTLVSSNTLTTSFQLENSNGTSSTSPHLLPLTAPHNKKHQEPPLQIDLTTTGWTGALMGGVSLDTIPVSMMIDIKAPNVFVFQQAAIAEQHACLFGRTPESVNFYSYCHTRESGDEEVHFEYDDKSGHWGYKEVGLVWIFKQYESQSKTLDKKFKFTCVDKISDATAISRGVDYGGVLGLNGLQDDTSGGTNFIQALMRKKVIKSPSFSVYYQTSPGPRGRILFGGVDEHLLATGAQMSFFPVVPSDKTSKKPTSWSIAFDKLMFGDTVILENFVAEFDTTFPNGVSDPTGTLVGEYVELLKRAGALLSKSKVHMEGVQVDCDKIATLPALRFVAHDDKGGVQNLDILPADMFSTLLGPKSTKKKENEDQSERSTLCRTTFFESKYVYDEDGNSASGDGGGGACPEVSQRKTAAAAAAAAAAGSSSAGDGGKKGRDGPTKIGLGLEFLNSYYMEFQLGRKKAPSLIGIGRSNKEGLTTIDKNKIEAIKKHRAEGKGKKKGWFHKAK